MLLVLLAMYIDVHFCVACVGMFVTLALAGPSGAAGEVSDESVSLFAGCEAHPAEGLQELLSDEEEVEEEEMMVVVLEEGLGHPAEGLKECLSDEEQEFEDLPPRDGDTLYLHASSNVYGAFANDSQ